MNRLTHNLALFSMLGLLLLSACQNDEPMIGNDVINQEDLIATIFTDTLTLEASIEERPAIDLTQPQALGTFLFGRLDDPTFGKSVANIYTQITPGINDLKFDSLPSLDSVILTLAFPTTRFVYGDNEPDQELNVYEVEIPSPVNQQESYSTSDSYPLKRRLGGITFRFPDSSDSLAPITELRIPLNNDFGTRLIEESQNGNDTYLNVSTFLDYLNGIALIPGDNNSSIGFFDLKGSVSNLTIYYKALYPENVSSDEPSYIYGNRSRTFDLRDFVVGGGTTVATSVNEFKHDYSGSVVENVLNNGDVSDLAYLQGMAGIQMRVKIPYLQNLGNIILNSASLEITGLINEEDSLFGISPRIEVRLDPLDVANTDIARLSYLDYVSPTFGATETDSMTNELVNRYSMPVPFSIQRLLTEEAGSRDMIIRVPEDGANYITGGAQFVNPYRAILAGPEHPNYPMKLNLYYTQIE